MITKQDLKAYRKSKLKYKALQEHCRELRSTIESVQAQRITDMPKGSMVGDAMADNLERLIEAEDDCNEALRQLILQEDKIKNAIYSVQDPMEQAVLINYYILGYDWEKVAVTMGYSTSRIFVIHGNALKTIVKSS